MSLINQMLKDLEQRNAGGEGGNPLHGEVRAVDPGQGKGMRLALGAIVLALLAVGAWWQWGAHKEVAPPAPPVQPAPPAPPAAQVQLSPPAPPGAQIQPPAPAAASSVAEPSPSAEPVGRLSGLERELRTAPAVHVTPAPEPGQTVAQPAPPVASAPEPAQPAAPDKPKVHPKPLPASPATPIKRVTPQQRSENLYRQAVGLLQQGRVAEARVTLEQALQENAVNHDARQLLVSLLLEGKHTAEAFSLLQEGVRIAPEQSGFVMALARLQVEAGDAATALQTMEQGAPYAGEDAEFLGFHATLLQRNARHAEAIPRYLAALQSDPANVSWLVGVGISLEAEGRDAEARAAYARAQQVGLPSVELSDFVAQRLQRLQDR